MSNLTIGWADYTGEEMAAVTCEDQAEADLFIRQIVRAGGKVTSIA